MHLVWDTIGPTLVIKGVVEGTKENIGILFGLLRVYGNIKKQNKNGSDVFKFQAGVRITTDNKGKYLKYKYT